MYLKRLEIQGFKSFANKTTLDFLPPKDGVFSLTSIVGPNGSGKSNVTDAIRWVMGETSMKNVRAKKSEDVIFNGSENKGAMGSAEVSMTLDNKDNDFNDEVLQNYPEITITRRLYRTGESEYLVNNMPSRLIDIHLLLARARFAQHAYSIVGQGMIDRLLTVTPAERKDFFDEACGIKEQQIKQHQAQLKLVRTEENIKQAETLLAEVEPRLNLLRRQVRKLEKRQEVEQELTAAQERYYSILFSRSKKEMDEVKLKLQTLNTSYRAGFSDLEKTQGELAELARGSSRQQVFESLQNKYQEVVKEKNELERQLVILEGQMQTKYSEAGAHNVGWIENKVSELSLNISGVKGRLEEARAEADRNAKMASEQKKQLENISIEQTQQRLKISRLQTQLLSNQSEQSYRDIVGLTAVKAVLENRKKFGKVHGLVAELAEVDEEYRLALEVASGAHLSSIVVEDEIVAREAINFLRENKYGVATFLPHTRVRARQSYTETESLLREEGVLGKAINLIRFDSKFDNIFSMILGDTIVVKNLRVAERLGIGRARMVTLDGDLVEQRGIMRGGYRNRRGNITFSAKLTLSNDEQMQEMQSALTLETNNLVELERKMESTKSKMVDFSILERSSTEKVRMIESELTNDEKEVATLKRELSLFQSGPEEYSQHLKGMAEEKEKVLKKILAADKIVVAASGDIEKFNREEEEKKQRVFALQGQMQKEQEKVNQILNERNDLSVQMAKLETHLEDLSQEVMNEMKVSLESVVSRVPTPVADAAQLDVLAGDIQKLKYQLSLIGGIDEEVVKEYGETKERYEFLDGQLTDLRSAMEDLQTMIEELDALMKKKRAVAFKKIRHDFDRYFQILFGGGKANLEEIYGEPPVEIEEVIGAEVSGVALVQQNEAAEEEKEVKKKKNEKVLTGIEVMANPPGKKVRYLSMLSGGERTLTSIALICAILFNNPSPFVVLDEVEAALDEANTLRFVKIMSELSHHSQFIIVTHNRVTMHAADALYGVVMGTDGVSKLLSVKIEDVAKID
ncbi:MAG: AAA family ATPase [Patescibacteria group bacterium]|jgi:chromosome segregation protein